jgi:hypothetical protein
VRRQFNQLSGGGSSSIASVTGSNDGTWAETGPVALAMTNTAPTMKQRMNLPSFVSI